MPQDPNAQTPLPDASRKNRAPAATILVGTPESVRLLANQMGLLPETPPAVGCVLLEESNYRTIAALPVLGFVRDLALIARAHKTSHDVGSALVCLPAATAERAQGISSALKSAGLAVRFITPLDEQLAGTAAPITTGTVSIDVGALIGRTPYGIDRRVVSRAITDKKVLITGAGGSIGSEIVRICATFNPAQILLMERSENALFEIDRQLRARFPDIPRKALLHDVVDAEQTLRLLNTIKPDAVFHAAAHKHVPLMEDHPAHAVTNNLFGTKSIADAALACGAERFVLISSDKAVNPTSVMGATKRLAEMYIQSLHKETRAGGKGGTSFSMVRFGNVLGSACSVLPIWTTQMQEGGPVTVTDPRMTRYFMTIPEAASLVIQAGAIDLSKEPAAAVYVLDMGEPVRILDLARRFIRAHGYEPVIRDAGTELAPTTTGLPAMEIRLSGIRPGEKLHEELAYAAEQLRATPFPGINAWAGATSTPASIAALLADMQTAKTSTDHALVVSLIRKHVPEMVTPEQGTRAA